MLSQECQNGIVATFSFPSISYLLFIPHLMQRLPCVFVEAQVIAVLLNEILRLTSEEQD